MLKCLSRIKKFPYGTDTQMMGGHLEHTNKSDDPGQIIATLIHYLHLCTHKYLEISNNNTPGLYSNRVKHRNGAAGQSVPAMQHHVFMPRWQTDVPSLAV